VQKIVLKKKTKIFLLKSYESKALGCGAPMSFISQ